jgi:hypothetical protein
MADTDGDLTAARRRFAVEIPGTYRASRHLLGSAAFGVLGIAAALASLTRVRPAELCVVPATLLAMNLLEYGSHRYLMHRRTRALPYAYAAHTLRHHACFPERALAVTSPRELWLILFGPREVALFALATAPPFALLACLASRNTAALAAASMLAHYLLYEGLHLVSHLPDEHWLSRGRALAGFRRRHARHHGAASEAFNVTFPLGDWLFGTLGQARRRGVTATAPRR